MIFFSIAAMILMLAYCYIGQRVITPSKLSGVRKKTAWAFLLLLPCSLPLSYLLRSSNSAVFWGDVMGWTGYTSLGFFSLVLILLLLRDTVWGVFRLVRRAVVLSRKLVNSFPTGTQFYDSGRRGFLIRSMNLGILGTAGLFTGYGFYEARRRPTVVSVSIHLPALDRGLEGFRIAQISDIHAGPTIKHEQVAAIVDIVNDLGADLIVFTGDCADGRVPALRDDVAPLRDLAASHGAYFVTGNHEYYSGALPWIEEIDRLGFTVLLNDHRIIEQAHSRLVLAGVTDYSAGAFIGNHVSDPAAALAGAPGGCVKILLAHQPRSVYTAAMLGYDLQLSGHTHGGQNLFWSSLVALTQPFIRGLHRYEDTWIYVNSGAGYWGPPLRVGVPSEITLFTLTGFGDGNYPKL